MKTNYDVPSPYSVQLEPVEGCSLACSFCGIQAIRENGADAELNIHGKNSAPYRFMAMGTLENLLKSAADAEWNPRWEFAMHGDPSIHPKITEMIALVRKYNPKGYVMLTTNGSGLLKNAPAKIRAYFAAGLNTLALDDYEHSGGWVPNIKKQLEDDILESVSYATHRYPQELEGNPHKRHNKRKLVFIHDISHNENGTHQLTNQGGASFAAISEPLMERCAKPFREFSVRWNGNVAICCDDWPGSYKIGNVNETSAHDLWYHPHFEAARRKLYAADRRFGPCKGCNVRTYRNGLLPDKLGRGAMEPPDAESMRYVATALKGRVFTIKLGP